MKNLIKAAAILALAQSTVACLAPMTVEVKPELADLEDEITQEVFDAMDFMQRTYNLDENQWELGLKVVVYGEHLGTIPCPADASEGAVCYRVGGYTHGRNLLEIQWGQGSCTNALIHELVHRMSRVQGHYDDYFGEGNHPSVKVSHNPVFHEITEEAERLWREERGCNESGNQEIAYRTRYEDRPGK
jgi:hypothetical protein